MNVTDSKRTDAAIAPNKEDSMKHYAARHPETGEIVYRGTTLVQADNGNGDAWYTRLADGTIDMRGPGARSLREAREWIDRAIDAREGD